jgi:hypothetical protein
MTGNDIIMSGAYRGTYIHLSHRPCRFTARRGRCGAGHPTASPPLPAPRFVASGMQAEGAFPECTTSDDR